MSENGFFPYFTSKQLLPLSFDTNINYCQYSPPILRFLFFSHMKITIASPVKISDLKKDHILRFRLTTHDLSNAFSLVYNFTSSVGI